MLLCLTIAGAALGGCAMGASNAPTAAPTAKPTQTMAVITPQPTNSPAMSEAPAATPQVNTAASAMTPSEAGKLAERISEAVERISEVDDAQAVISDNRVLIAVEFDDQYAAGLDERMKQTITQEVHKIDETLTDIRITDDGTLYGQVKSLGERLMKATGMEELADDFGSLWDRIKSM